MNRPLPLLAVVGLFALACSGPGACRDIKNEAGKVVPILQEIGGGGHEKVECEPAKENGLHHGCSLQTLQCGDTVEGNNSNGLRNWGDDFYQKAFCTPQRHDYDDGPEAVYALHLQPNVEADIRLDSNCADLDIVGVGWNDPSSCPQIQHHNRIRQCEMGTESGGDTIRWNTVDKSEVLLVGVDGKEGATGNYRIVVTCRTYR